MEYRMDLNNNLCNFAQRKRRRKVWKRFFQIYILFFLTGILFPPLFQKELLDHTPTDPSNQAAERVLCIDDNSDALLWRLRMIDSAQQEIILATFDWREDNSGRDILAAMLVAADRGVHIRILVDGLAGTVYLRGNGSFRALAAMPNVEIKFYNPVSLLKPWTLNYRMHDKYLIIDDTVYLLGGRNTYDLFLGSYVDTYNLDRDVLVYSEVPREMSSLSQLQAYFMQAWTQDCSRTMTVRSTKTLEKHQAALRAHELTMRDRYPTAFTSFEWKKETIQAHHVYLLSNSAEPRNKDPRLWNELSALMKQGTDIQVQTPYIICNQMMYKELGEICDSADTVQIMTNAVEIGANPFGCTDYLNQKNRILDSGAVVVEWMGGRSLHTKTVLIDDNLCVIGSFNMDMRSVYLDTELMVVIDCPELNRELQSTFRVMAEQSKSVALNGSIAMGTRCEDKNIPFLKACLYLPLRIALWPIRYLL